MKYYINSVFNAIIVILIFMLNIKKIKGASIKCIECRYDNTEKKCKKGSNDCPSYCRPHFFGECYDCSSIFANEKNQLYSIKDGECFEKFQDDPERVQDVYVISETNEFVKKDSIIEENRKVSPKFYVFGYFIYRQCPEGTTFLDTTYEVDEVSFPWYLCICSSLTYSFDIFGKSFYKCVSSCPYGYNQNAIEKYLCLEKCDTDHPKVIVSNNTCVSDCKNDEYYFSYSIGEKQYCSNRCPSSAPFYYSRDGNNEVECRDECNEKDFYYSISKKCTQKCNDHKSLIDIENSIFICDETRGIDDECPPDFPYKYKKSCLKKCSDTYDDFFTSSTHFDSPDPTTKTTYSLISGGTKKCVVDCTNTSESDKNYYDDETYTCIDDCKKTSKKFSDGNKCVSSCGSKFHNYGEYNCFNSDECSSTFRYKSYQDYTCYDDCSKLSPIFYYNQQKTECVLECFNNKYILKKREGETYDFYCLDSCNGINENLNYNHRYGDNICIENCTINSYYHIKEGNVCYQSCKEIANNKIYEYSSQCYDSVDDSFKNILHYTVNGVTKYKSPEDSDSDIKFCSKAGFYYIRKYSDGTKECVNCNDNSEYRIPYSLDEDGDIKSLGECFGSTKCNETYPYYNEEKICFKDCNYKKLVDKNNPSVIVYSRDSNCVKECTDDVYKYESSDGTICYNECPTFYYKKRDGKFKCIDDCTTVSMFYDTNQSSGECKDKCSTNGYSYYIPGNINNKCLSTCQDQGSYKFSLLGSTTNPQPCLKECPLRYKYYYDTNNICLQNCNPGDYIDQDNKCVTECTYFIINGNECSTECTKDAPFLDAANHKKCVIKCNSTNHLYYDSGNRLSNGQIVYQCANSCGTNFYQLEFGNKCVRQCPEETFQVGNTCKLKCIGSVLTFKKIISADGIRNFTCQACSATEYIGSNNECIPMCPREENFFIQSTKKCQHYCDNFYKKTNQIGTDQYGSYNIYECLTTSDCGSEKVIDGTKECVSTCPPEKPYLLGTNVCVSICLKDQITPFSAKIGNEKRCEKKCSTDNGNPKYFGDDKICISDCGIYEYKKYHNEKLNDFSCVSHCDLKSENRFSYKSDANKYYCLNKCTQLNPSDTKKYYSTDDYVCDSKCNERNRFLIASQNICTNKCPDNLVANPSTDEVSDYTCEYTCDQGKYYYENERICGQCKSNHYIIQGSQKCIEFCDQINSKKKYYYYEASESSPTIKNNTCVTECPADKPFVDYNNHCSESCTQESHKFYTPSEKICLDKCPKGTLKNGDKCVEKCPNDKVQDSIAGECLPNCLNAQRNYIFYYEKERECLPECRAGDFVFKDGDKYKCMNNCSNVNEGLNKQLYIDGNKCVETCSEYNRFFVSQKIYGEQNISKYCLTDCPIGYEFYNENNENSYECSGICYNYYITNKDPNVNAKKCVENCGTIYPYILIHNNTHKECVEFCPDGKMYYDETKTCYDSCPPTAPFHEKGNFECIKECPSKKANKKTKECVTDCEINQFWAEETQNKVTTKMCYDNCNQTNYAQFSTFDKKCVKDCDQEDENLQGNLYTGECECRGLYYMDDTTGKKQCLDTKIKLCTDSDYKIQVNGTNQCTKICFGVLSVDGDVCYWGLADSIKCPENSILGIFQGAIKCECQYGFYMNLKNKKVCLDKTLKCPDYKYFNIQTRECVEDCKDLYLLDDKCYSYCPTGMNPVNEGKKTCTCVYNFYRKDEDKYVCLGQDDLCPSEYPYLVEEKKECVKECSREYPILYDMKCRSDCEENYYKIKDPNNPDKYICVCNYIWYYQNDESICESENKNKKCKDLDIRLDYTVVKTKQCVSSCKEDYKYFFNKECYYDCSEANLVKDENTNECKCREKWRVNNNEIECTSKCDNNENLITETNQCIPKTSKCSYEKPLLWNTLCYDKCPENTEEDSIKGNTCKCKYNWFVKNDGLIECMERDKECPYDSHPYLIYQTKECVKNETFCENKYIFNFVCYDECPTNTIESTDESNKNCECNPDAGFWAKAKDQYGRNVLNCIMPSCGENKVYFNETKECVSSCEEISKYLYLGICYTDCPPLTTKVNNEYSCKLSTEFKNPDLKSLLENVESKITEISENIPSGGLVINNEENEATLQIFKLGTDEKKNKEALLRSNLGYIDVSECIDKIYKANKMSGREQVVVVKLDLKSNNKKLIVNPIEYEFRNSETGALLDASVCGRNEVVVSYPLTYLFKNKRKMRLLDDEEFIEIAEKFERGKMLYEKDKSIDSFNYNSTIYSNICYPIEVDGKDLTLNNRISYFYPNYSFCESTCAYDYTDFENERIFCNCSIKYSIDIDRTQGAKLAEYNKEETDSNQKGPTNVPAIKCMKYIKITKNPAFYVCLILFLVQLGLMFIIIFKSIAILVVNINKKLFKGDDLNESSLEEGFKMYGNKNNEFNNGKTSERNLNNPPKKNNYVDGKNNEKGKKAKGEKKAKKVVTEKKFEVLSEANSEEYYNYLRKNELDANRGFFTSVRKEDKYLRESFSVSMTKDKFDVVVVVLTSIFDKIYLSKVLFLSSKYQITTLMFSLYLLCHLLLLTLCALFFDINTISKIFENNNYPNVGYYILYGFLGNLIVWIIFKLFYCLIDNSNNIMKLIIKNNNNGKKMGKLTKLISNIKRDVIIYLVIQFVIMIVCSIYLITFCGIYTGTTTKVFLSYAFSLLTIIIIKIIYGFILGILRKISLFAEKNGLYNAVLIFNKYLS